MKKITALLSFFILLTAFTCEDEPLEDDFIIDNGNNLTCAEATSNTAASAQAFVNATDATYTQLCIAYKAALTAQIEACGDPTGALQATITTLGDCSTVATDCELAELATDNALDAFDNATDATYTQLCNALSIALENEIDACGDPDGSLQGQLNDLGDCIQTSPAVEISVVAGTLQLEFDVVNVVTVGTVLEVTGETSSTANDYSVYFEVEQGQTGVDIINPTFVLTTTSEFFPDTQGFDDFTSNITVNDTGTLQGTFNGIVTSADNANLSLTQGMIDIEY